MENKNLPKKNSVKKIAILATITILLIGMLVYFYFSDSSLFQGFSGLNTAHDTYTTSDLNIGTIEDINPLSDTNITIKDQINRNFNISDSNIIKQIENPIQTLQQNPLTTIQSEVVTQGQQWLDAYAGIDLKNIYYLSDDETKSKINSLIVSEINKLKNTIPEANLNKINQIALNLHEAIVLHNDSLTHDYNVNQGILDLFKDSAAALGNFSDILINLEIDDIDTFFNSPIYIDLMSNVENIFTDVISSFDVDEEEVLDFIKPNTDLFKNVEIQNVSFLDDGITARAELLKEGETNTTTLRFINYNNKWAPETFIDIVNEVTSKFSETPHENILEILVSEFHGYYIYLYQTIYNYEELEDINNLILDFINTGDYEQTRDEFHEIRLKYRQLLDPNRDTENTSDRGSQSIIPIIP